MEHTNLIYGLRDPNNDVYRYIGKTTIGNKRPLSHLIKSHNELVNSWVDELKKTGTHPIVDVIEKDILLEKLSERERYYISYYSSVHPLLNKEIGKHPKSRSIKSPSVLLPVDIETLHFALSDINEIYKLFKSCTGFTDGTIADTLGVGRKLVYEIKNNNKKVGMEPIFKMVLFLHHGPSAVFDHYYSNSHEFLGKHPDTYEEFMAECMNNSKFCKKWFNSFYTSFI